MNHLSSRLTCVFAFISLAAVLAACASEPADEAFQESSAAFTVPSTCVITQPGCQNYPPFSGRFLDDWMGSGSDPHRCMQRAAEYSQWCGNPPGVPTHVMFDAPAVGLHVENLYVAQ